MLLAHHEVMDCMSRISSSMHLLWARKLPRVVHQIFQADWVPFAFASLACGLVVGLLLFIVWMTFVPGLPTKPELSLGNYAEVFDSYLFRRVIPNTALVGVGTATVSLLFSVPLAWILHRTNAPFRKLWTTLIAVVVIVPGFLKAMGWFILLNGKNGLINSFFMQLFGLAQAPFDIESIWGIALVQGLMLTPTMFFLLAGPIRSLDPALEEAAQASGAPTWRIIWGISLPLLWPAILGGLIYVFMTALAIFEVPALLGGIGRTPVLATELFLNTQPTAQASATVPRYGIAGIYGLLIAVPSLVALYYYLRVIERGHRYAVITGKGYRPKAFDLGRGRYLALLFVFFYFLMAVLLPLLVLLWASLLPYLVMPSMKALSMVSLRSYTEIADVIGGFKVILNTTVLVVLTPIVVLFFSLMISWIVVRTQVRGRGLIDAIAMLPHAIPGLGFAFALVVLGILGRKWFPWLPLYQTIWIIVIANAVNRLAYATRITNAAMLQVGRELEEAAEVCGASRLGTMRSVTVPLIRPSLVFGGLWTGLLVFQEISMALMLSGPNSQVLSTRIWVQWEQGNLSEASALGVVMIAVMGCFVFFLQWMATMRLSAANRIQEH